MHLQFFDEVTGGNLDNKSTYWKISPSAVTNSTSLSRSSIGTDTIFHFVSRGKKIARKIYRFSKHVVIFFRLFSSLHFLEEKGSNR